MRLILLFILLFSVHSSSFDQTTLKELYDTDQYDTIIKLLGKKKDLTIKELTWLTRSYGRLGDFSNGIMYSEILLRRCKEANDTTNLVQAINVKLENLVDLGKYEEGLDFYDANSAYFRPVDSAEYQLVCFKMGVVYFYLEKYEKAYATYNEITMDKFRKLSLFKANYSLILAGIGKFDEAIEGLKESIQLEKKEGYSLSNSYSNIALFLMMDEQWDEAEVYLDSSSLMAHMSGGFIEKKSVYEKYYNLYSNIGDLSLSRRYLDSLSIINEQIFNERLDNKMIALEESFEREHSLKKKIVVVDNELVYYQKVRLWGVIVFLISLLVLGGIITFLWIRNIKSQNQNILIEQKLLRSQMTPHFMFNSLAILQGIILNKEYDKSINYLSKFSKLLRITLENSRDKVVPFENEIKAIENYIIVQNLGTEIPFHYIVDVDKTIDQRTLLIPPMMIQPFVENAIEHAFPPRQEYREIRVEIKFEDQNLTCSISDNGVGLEQSRSKKDAEKKSLSTTITSERLEMLGKEFKVKTSMSVIDRKVNNEIGTQVFLVLPYKRISND